MHRMLFPWSLPSPTLMTLSLDLPFDRRTPALDFQSYLHSVLESSPQLQDLSLLSLPCIEEPSLPQGYTRVPVRAVRNMQFGSISSLHVVAFWNMLSNIISSVSLEVRVSYWTLRSDGASIRTAQNTFFRQWASHFLHEPNAKAGKADKASKTGPFAGMSLRTRPAGPHSDEPSDNKCRIEFWSKSDLKTGDRTARVPANSTPVVEDFDTLRVTANSCRLTKRVSLTLPAYVSYEGPTCFRTVKALDGHFPLSSITAVKIIALSSYTEERWISFLKRICGVQTLYIRCSKEAISLIRVLGRFSTRASASGGEDGDIDERSQAAVPLPRLNRLCLYVENPKEVKDDYGIIWYTLSRALERRSEEAYGIRSLRLEVGRCEQEDAPSQPSLRMLAEKVSTFDYVPLNAYPVDVEDTKDEEDDSEDGESWDSDATEIGSDGKRTIRAQ